MKTTFTFLLIPDRRKDQLAPSASEISGSHDVIINVELVPP